MEDYPKIHVQFSDDVLEVRRDNSSLWTFAGELATRNHVFIEADEQPEEGITLGYPLFESLQPEAFVKLYNHMVTYEYPLNLNQLGLTNGVEEAFQDAIETQVETEAEEFDSFPDEWAED